MLKNLFKLKSTTDSLRIKVYYLMIQMAFLATLLLLLVDVIFTNDPISIVLELITLFFTLVLIRRIEQKKRHPVNHYLFIATFMVIVNAIWITGGGHSVANFMIYFMITSTSIYMLSQNETLIFGGFALFNITILYYTEYLHPEYYDWFEQEDDIFNEYLLVIVPYLIGLIITYNVKRFYLDEHFNVKRNNLKLREQEKSLSAIKEQYEIATQAGQTGIVDWYPLEGKLYIDPALRSMTGYTEMDAPNHSLKFHEFFMENHSHKLRENIRDSFVKKRTYFESRLHFKHKSGKSIWLLFRTKMQYNTSGICYRMIGSATNISEMINYEKELILKGVQLEKSLKEKEDFFSIMSHELRTPLNSVIGLSNYLMAKNKNKELSRVFEVLTESATQTYKLVNDILDYNRFKNHQIEVKEDSVKIKSALKQLSLRYEIKSRSSNLNWSCGIADDLPDFIYCDLPKLKQVIENLLSNALKFTYSGKIVMKVGLKSRNEDSVWISFSISDTGIGIEDDKLEDIWLPYESLKTDNYKNSEGMGLGLTIVKSILELLNGEIEINSKKGEGTTIEFTIPFKLAPVEQPPRKELLSNPIKGKRILYVEDVMSNRFLIKNVCSEWGAIIDLAESGEVAIAMASKLKYDLILMDLFMPEYDGFITSSEIRIGINKNTPIVAFTADSSDITRKKVKEHHMLGPLLKPIDIEKLYNTIADVISKHLNH